MADRSTPQGPPADYISIRARPSNSQDSPEDQVPLESADARRAISSVNKKASTACSACRQRKSKCSTTIPCDACQTAGTPCVYDAAKDRRRKVAATQSAEQLARTRALLREVFEIIRFGDEHLITFLRLLLQADTPVLDMVTEIRQLRARLRLPPDESASFFAALESVLLLPPIERPPSSGLSQADASERSMSEASPTEPFPPMRLTQFRYGYHSERYAQDSTAASPTQTTYPRGYGASITHHSSEDTMQHNTRPMGVPRQAPAYRDPGVRQPSDPSNYRMSYYQDRSLLNSSTPYRPVASSQNSGQFSGQFSGQLPSQSATQSPDSEMMLDNEEPTPRPGPTDIRNQADGSSRPGDASQRDRRRRRMSINDIIDKSPYCHINTDWTKEITIDIGLVHYLLSIYLVWDAPFMPLVDRSLFLKNLDLGPNSSMGQYFCSGLLLSAICAFSETCLNPIPRAILLTQHKGTPNSTRPADQISAILNLSYIKQAQDLFETAERHTNPPSIADVQARVLLARLEYVEGRTALAETYRRSAFTLFQRLANRVGASNELSKVRDTAAEGQITTRDIAAEIATFGQRLVAVDTMIAWIYRTKPLLGEIPIANVAMDELSNPKICTWTMFPLCGEDLTFDMSLFDSINLRLAVIARRVTLREDSMLLSGTRVSASTTAKEQQQLYVDLCTLHDNIPTLAPYDEHASTAPAHLFLLSLYTDVVTLALLKQMQEARLVDPEQLRSRRSFHTARLLSNIKAYEWAYTNDYSSELLALPLCVCGLSIMYDMAWSSEACKSFSYIYSMCEQAPVRTQQYQAFWGEARNLAVELEMELPHELHRKRRGPP